jgi:hypothetical protein
MHADENAPEPDVVEEPPSADPKQERAKPAAPENKAKAKAAPENRAQ